MSEVESNYKEYLDSYTWKAVKKVKLEENPECEVCWDDATTVHHLSYERLWREKENDIVSICESCHHECHFIEWYQIKNSWKELKKRFKDVKENTLPYYQSRCVWFNPFWKADCWEIVNEWEWLCNKCKEEEDSWDKSCKDDARMFDN